MAKINRLKVVLVEKEKSGKWLADQLGKSTCTVSKWCSNTTQPDLQTLDKIAKMLDVNVKELQYDDIQRIRRNEIAELDSDPSDISGKIGREDENINFIYFRAREPFVYSLL